MHVFTSVTIRAEAEHFLSDGMLPSHCHLKTLIILRGSTGRSVFTGRTSDLIEDVFAWLIDKEIIARFGKAMYNSVSYIEMI